MDEFRTEHGRCVVDPTVDELRLDSSWRGYLRNRYEGSRLWFLVTVLSTVFLAFNALSGPPWAVLGGVGIGLGFVGVAWLHTRFSRFTTDETVRLSGIDHVEADGGSSVTNPRFDVHYRRHGERVTRRITLPSKRLSGTMDGYEEAWRTFERHGVPVEHA